MQPVFAHLLGPPSILIKTDGQVNTWAVFRPLVLPYHRLAIPGQRDFTVQLYCKTGSTMNVGLYHSGGLIMVSAATL